MERKERYQERPKRIETMLIWLTIIFSRSSKVLVIKWAQLLVKRMTEIEIIKCFRLCPEEGHRAQERNEETVFIL